MARNTNTVILVGQKAFDKLIPEFIRMLKAYKAME